MVQVCRADLRPACCDHVFVYVQFVFALRCFYLDVSQRMRRFIHSFMSSSTRFCCLLLVSAHSKHRVGVWVFNMHVTVYLFHTHTHTVNNDIRKLCEALLIG